MSITSLLTGGGGTVVLEGSTVRVQVDASVEEIHSFRSEVTRNPIEEGADTTDHVRNLPDGLRVVGVVTNHPSNFLGPLTAGGPRRAKVAFASLEVIHAERLPITVRTGLKSYDNMVMESLEIPKTARLAEVTRFTATFTRIRTVKSGTVAVPNTNVQRAKPAVNKGRQPPKPASSGQAASFLKKGLSWGQSLLGGGG